MRIAFRSVRRVILGLVLITAACSGDDASACDLAADIDLRYSEGWDALDELEAESESWRDGVADVRHAAEGGLPTARQALADLVSDRCPPP